MESAAVSPDGICLIDVDAITDLQKNVEGGYGDGPSMKLVHSVEIQRRVDESAML